MPFFWLITLPYGYSLFTKSNKSQDNTSTPTRPKHWKRNFTQNISSICSSATNQTPNWIEHFKNSLDSVAETTFLDFIVREKSLTPVNGKLVGPGITLEMQVSYDMYRFDFLINGSHIVEIDGAQWHSSEEAQARDKQRDLYCASKGFKILRIPASVVFNQKPQLLAKIDACLQQTPVFSRPVVAPEIIKPAPERRSTLDVMAESVVGSEKYIEQVKKDELKKAEQLRLDKAIKSIKLLIDTKTFLITQLTGELSDYGIFALDKDYNMKSGSALIDFGVKNWFSWAEDRVKEQTVDGLQCQIRILYAFLKFLDPSIQTSSRRLVICPFESRKQIKDIIISLADNE